MPLSTVKIGKRKRSREDIEDSSSGQLTSANIAKSDQPDGGPLQDVIACLSGLDQARKEDLHRLILSLGGRYTRELNLDKNTHLITEIAKGAKYGLAVSSSPHAIHIVTPSWLISTSEIGKRARETDFTLQSTISNLEGKRNSTIDISKRPLVSLVDDILHKADDDCNLKRSFLFEKLQFYLVGFESNVELKQKLSEIIRCGNGIIHWTMNENISILLLCDKCDDALQKAARVIATHHSNFPPIVSPLWVIESYRHSILQPVSAYPKNRHESQQSNYNDGRLMSTKKGSNFTSKTSSMSSTTSKVSIFRGCLFSLVRSSTMTESEPSKCVASSNVEFDAKELETLIMAYGGQILSVKLLDALRADGENVGGGNKRKCHVVCWGESPPRLETNSLVSQLQRHNLCETILVTPIWLKACVSLRKRIRPERMPMVLMPQLWPMKAAFKAPCQSTQIGLCRKETPDFSNSHSHRYPRLGISLTGFQGTEKVVIVHLIGAIGGVYHEKMSNTNTHLVFKKNPIGLKLEKAIVWGLKVVSIQWLYHTLKYGHGGIHKDELGCEKKFSFRV